MSGCAYFLRLVRSLFAGGLFLVALSAPASVFSGEKVWATYANARFGFAIDYPESALLPQGESENGDGQTFLSPDGKVRLVAYAGHNALEISLEQELANVLADALADVTTKTLGENWFVISGLKDGEVFFRKTILANDIFYSFQISCPEARKDAYALLIQRIAGSFKVF